MSQKFTHQHKQKQKQTKELHMIHIKSQGLAPELDVQSWLNTPEPLTLSGLRGKVVVIHAFQMLCPGCVSHGIPQATAIHALYANDEVQVIGLHSVFEHHQVMNVEALKAFVGEYGLSFPIAVDKPSTTGSSPRTMKTYQMRGTPTLIILDQHGHVRLNHFGRLSDMHVGNLIGYLLAEGKEPLLLRKGNKLPDNRHRPKCDDDTCLI